MPPTSVGGAVTGVYSAPARRSSSGPGRPRPTLMPERVTDDGYGKPRDIGQHPRQPRSGLLEPHPDRLQGGRVHVPLPARDPRHEPGAGEGNRLDQPPAREEPGRGAHKERRRLRAEVRQDPRPGGRRRAGEQRHHPGVLLNGPGPAGSRRVIPF